MSQLQAALGNTSASTALRNEAAAIASAFTARFYHANNASFGTGTDDELVYALGLGLVPAATVPSVVATLRTQVQARGYFNVDAFGVWLLRDVLEMGLASLVGEWLVRTAYPSYGYFLSNSYANATTMMEHWNTPAEDTSHNHAWLNSVSLLFRSRILGLSPVHGSARAGAWQRARVRPWPAALVAAKDSNTADGHKGARGGLDTVQGVVTVAWTQWGNGRCELLLVGPGRCDGVDRFLLLLALLVSPCLSLSLLISLFPSFFLSFFCFLFGSLLSTFPSFSPVPSPCRSFSHILVFPLFSFHLIFLSILFTSSPHPAALFCKSVRH